MPKQLLNNLNRYKQYIVLGFVALLVTAGARMFIKQGLSGDEPHYLMMAQSIKLDHDLNLANNFSQTTYKQFYKDDLDPHINVKLVDIKSTKVYSIHGAGLPFVLAPSLYLGYRLGPLIIMLLIAVLAVLQVYSVSANLVSKKGGLLAAGLLISSVPFLSLAGYIFPDLVGGLLLVATFATILRIIKRPRRLDYAWLSLLSGLMIWIHVKTILIAVTALAIVGVLTLYQKVSTKVKVNRILWLAIPFTVLYLILTYNVNRWFGVILPTQIYQGNGQMFQISPLYTLPAMLFDGFKGLFTLAPALLLIFVGLPLWSKEHKDHVAIVGALISPSLLIQSTFNDWAGGWSTPARYLMLYVPLLAISLAYVYKAAAKNNLIKWLVILLSVLQVVTSLLYVALKVGWGSVGTESVFYMALSQRLYLSPQYLQANFDSYAVANNSGVVSVVVGVTLIGVFTYIGWAAAHREK